MMRSEFLQFNVLTPGLYTTVQDNGRYGYQKYGIPVSGVLDSFSARIANALVGNDSNCALLEITVFGPTLRVMNDAYIAVTGADVEVLLNKKKNDTWKAFRVRPGDLVEIGQARSRCRAYLAVTGGIQVAPVMGSMSCCAGGGFGGTDGRPLQEGDKIMRGSGRFLQRSLQLPVELLPNFGSEIVLRAIAGPQDDYFDEGVATFFSAEFVVSQDSNRIGCRLEGPPVRRKEGMPTSIISEPSMAGGIQITPNGQPIILLREQTIGGYAKIATVISADLDLIGQASPGTRIRFEKVGLETAYHVLKEKAKVVERILTIIELMAQVSPRLWDIPEYVHDEPVELFRQLYPGC